jgi:hypothetical protein
MFILFFCVILNYIVSKEEKLPNPKKIAAIANMSKQKTAKNIQVLNNMAQFYCCFIWNFIFIMALITKLLQKTKVFKWTPKH